MEKTRRFNCLACILICAGLFPLIPTSTFAAAAAPPQASVRSLLKLSVDQTRHPRVRSLARQTILRRGKQAIPALLREARSSQSNLRAAALLILGQGGELSAESVILDVVSDKKSSVLALGEHGAMDADAKMLGKGRVSLGLFQAEQALTLLYSHADTAMLSSRLRGELPAAFGNKYVKRTVAVTRAALRALLLRNARDGNPRALSPYFTTLRELLGHPVSEVRRLAATVIEASGDTQFESDLIKRLQVETHAKVLLALARALRKICSEKGLKALFQLLDKIQKTPPLIVPLKKGDPPEKSASLIGMNSVTRQFLEVEIAAALGRDQPEDTLVTVKALGRCLRNPQRPPGVRRRAAELLGELQGEASRRELVLACADRDPEIRVATIQALTVISDRKSLPAVQPLLDDDNVRVRVAAALNLQALGETQGVEERLVSDLQDTSPSVRAEAVSGLGALRLVTTLKRLAPLTKDANLEVACRAVEAMRDIGDESAAPFLLAALQDKRPPVRNAAREALLKIIHSDPGDDPTHWRVWAREEGLAWPTR